MLADQPALHAALDRAGLSAERVVTVQTEPAGTTLADAGGNAPGNAPSGERRPPSGYDARQQAATPAHAASIAPTIRTRPARAGVDITA